MQKIMMFSLFIVVIAHMSCDAFDPKVRLMTNKYIKQRQTQKKAQSVRQSPPKTSVQSRTSSIIKSPTVQKAEQQRAKMLAAAGAQAKSQPTITRNICNQILIEGSANNEKAYLLRGKQQRQPINITPAGSDKIPANAIILGTFSDKNLKTRYAYIPR